MSPTPLDSDGRSPNSSWQFGIKDILIFTTCVAVVCTFNLAPVLRRDWIFPNTYLQWTRYSAISILLSLTISNLLGRGGVRLSSISPGIWLATIYSGLYLFHQVSYQYLSIVTDIKIRDPSQIGNLSSLLAVVGWSLACYFRYSDRPWRWLFIAHVVRSLAPIFLIILRLLNNWFLSLSEQQQIAGGMDTTPMLPLLLYYAMNRLLLIFPLSLLMPVVIDWRYRTPRDLSHWISVIAVFISLSAVTLFLWNTSVIFYVFI
jgi:hypothetical protein